MAEGYQDVFGYKTGDSATFALRSVARVLNAGNGLYTYIETDKPILSSTNTCHVSITSLVIYNLSGTDAVTADTNNITIVDIVKNKILFTIPTNNISTWKTYYLEGMVTVQF